MCKHGMKNSKKIIKIQMMTIITTKKAEKKSFYTDYLHSFI